MLYCNHIPKICIMDHGVESPTENSDELNPHLYIHIIPKETGEKWKREIVPANVIKKFNYDTYKKNDSIYKKTKFSFKRAPGGGKQKCYVLYAGG